MAEKIHRRLLIFESTPEPLGIGETYPLPGGKSLYIRPDGGANILPRDPRHSREDLNIPWRVRGLHGVIYRSTS